MNTDLLQDIDKIDDPHDETEPPMRISRLAVAAMAAGLAGILLIPVNLGLFGVSGIVIGILAIRAITRNEAEIEGKGFAALGIVSGTISSLMAVSGLLP